MGSGGRDFANFAFNPDSLDYLCYFNPRAQAQPPIHRNLDILERNQQKRRPQAQSRKPPPHSEAYRAKNKSDRKLTLGVIKLLSENRSDPTIKKEVT